MPLRTRHAAICYAFRQLDGRRHAVDYFAVSLLLIAAITPIIAADFRCRLRC